jgi:hypothetical protein
MALLLVPSFVFWYYFCCEISYFTLFPLDNFILMKKIYNVLIGFALSMLFYACEPLASIKIETLVPSPIEFPGNFNKLVFVNADTDINNDGNIDTMLYNMITSEMNLGFLEAINSTTSIDSSEFLFVKGFPKREMIYTLDTIYWKYLENLTKNTNADLFIILDSIHLTMDNEYDVDYMAYPTEYYHLREMAVNIHWSVFDLVEKKRLDQYNYQDTLFWESVEYSEAQLKRKIPSLEKCIREMSFFSALDYGNRILPGWQQEYRYYYEIGNKDFKQAAIYVKQNDWDSASQIWTKYIDNIDRELASRACFNLALANEMKGDFKTAINWAEQSNKIKNKTKTRYYISKLKTRQKNVVKLQKQL